MVSCPGPPSRFYPKNPGPRPHPTPTLSPLFITCSTVATEMVLMQTEIFYFVIYGLPITQGANIAKLYINLKLTLSSIQFCICKVSRVHLLKSCDIQTGKPGQLCNWTAKNHKLGIRIPSNVTGQVTHPCGTYITQLSFLGCYAPWAHQQAVCPVI